MQQALRARVRTLPRRPGVYLWKDAGGRVLYVGKAGNLRARVGQYVAAARLEPAKRELVRRAADIETIITNNDTEALALEATLIGAHDPPYNVRLVDDSSYLYVKIPRTTVPTVELVRRVLPDGAWYRGPYPSALAIRRTLREARRLFPWCSAPPAHGSGVGGRGPGQLQTPDSRLQTPAKPCFAYHLGLCPGICAGKVTVEEYQQSMQGLQRFLDGDVRDALRQLRARMDDASQQQAYERAARLRDAIRAVERATTPLAVATPRRESVDVLGLARRKQHAAVAVLSVRQGRVVGSRAFPLLVPLDESNEDILRGFLLAYLPKAADGAKELLVPREVEDAALLAQQSERAQARESARTALPLHPSRSLALTVPRRGRKRRLLELARTNAEEALRKTAAELESPAALQDALRDLARVLHLPHPPRRIEAYDISTTQGILPTGSLVVFHDGKPKRSEYRKFKIAAAGKADDYAMMEEVLRRRFRHVQHQVLDGKTPGVGQKPAHWPLPDLVLLDGGKGQLNVGLAVLRELHPNIPLAALAKREEGLFLPGNRQKAVGSRGARPRSVRLPPDSPALFLLQRLRDEAHRFTLGYHQLLRKKRLTRSLLEDIPGVGAVTRKKLLRAFGSLRGVKAASEDELAEIVGTARAVTIRRVLTTG